MFETLYGKTFLVLSSQLALTWLSTVWLLQVFRKHYHAKADWIGGGVNMEGQLDLELSWHFIKPYFWVLLIANMAVFLALLFMGTHNLKLGIPLFCVWSVLTGFELALCLVSVDENLGAKVLAITALITFGAGLVGALSGIDFSSLRGILFTALLLLIAFGLIRIFFSIPRWLERVGAFCGVVVFSTYLLYDFHRLSLLGSNAGSNTWEVAVRISISIYLDIINLFLDLLDLMSR